MSTPGMAVSNRSDLNNNAISIDAIENELPYVIKSHILSFFGKIGTKDFKYGNLEFIDESGQTKIPTFQANFFVLLRYMERGRLSWTISLQLLWHIKIEETLALAKQNPKSLAIPVMVQDPYGQWVAGTPLQIMLAAGDRNPPEMKFEDKDFGLAERLCACFENPVHCEYQYAEWFGPDSSKATATTMAPYIAAIESTCQKIMEHQEITNNISWEDVIKLPIFFELADCFRKSLIPNPEHIVRSGFLFSIHIFIDLITIFEANVNNDTVEDKSRPNLGGWWNRKSEALDTITYPALQARSQRCDIGIFKEGARFVATGQTPLRLDFSNETPKEISGIGNTHFFGIFGDKFKADIAFHGRGEPTPSFLGMTPKHIFRNLFQSKTEPLRYIQPQPIHSPNPWCMIM